MIRNFIFDWSGTLVDDLPPVIDATNAVFRHFGKPAMDRATFVREFSLPFTHFYERVLPGVPFEDLDRVFCQAFNASTEPASILPHAKEFLEFCASRDCRMFVLSSALEKQLREQATQAGILHYFEHIYAEVVDKRERIGDLLAAHGLRSEETAYVGDMEHDIATAKVANLLSIAVLTGYDSREELAAAKPDITVNDLLLLRRIMTESQFEPAPNYPIATVGALIYDDKGHVLMIRTHKWSNRWGIPGGKIERGESSEKALRREILEETGLELADLRFQLVQDCIDSQEFYAPAHFLLVNYTAVRAAGEVTLNEEAEEFQWIRPESALAELDLNRPTRTLLEHVRSSGG